MRIAIGTCGLLLVALGSGWLYIYTLTDYRPHLRPLLIPLGAFAVVVGLHLLVWPFIRSFWRGDE